MLIESAADIDPATLGASASIGLTAGASTPESLVEEAIMRLRELGYAEVEELATAEENVEFPLPRELRGKPGGRVSGRLDDAES